MTTALPEKTVDLIRQAQVRWALEPVAGRLRFLGVLRHLIAENATVLASAAASTGGRPVAEKLVSEVLPLADACRWLERNAARVLGLRRHGRGGRPWWLQGFHFEVQRQPFGVVLVIGPGNYPLFLPAVHALHALAAGNAVRLKPAPGTGHVAQAFARLTFEAGLDPALLEILDDTKTAAYEAIGEGADKVVFTGSSENGRSVLKQLAASNTPSVMELSGNDAVLILPDADMDLVARALKFGYQLNGGNTCIAPRRIIVCGEAVADIACERVKDEVAAVRLVNSGEFALGTSIFSRDLLKARMLAAQIKTGFVLINDLIVPTADPRLPFGGVKGSGFGTTRGEEGLLEMTFPHVVGERRGGTHPHFSAPAAGDEHLFSAYLRAIHGGGGFAAWAQLLRALVSRIKISSSLL